MRIEKTSTASVTCDAHILSIHIYIYIHVYMYICKSLSIETRAGSSRSCSKILSCAGWHLDI